MERKTTEQLAEERERRRERLLAGRDSRLSKIVSSVGGTNYTPPSSIASPANIVHAPPVVGNTTNTKSAEKTTNATTTNLNAEVAAPKTSHPTASEAIPPTGGLIDAFNSEKKQIVGIVLINIGALIAGWCYLGKSCFKEAFGHAQVLYGSCSLKFEVARRAYFGLTAGLLLLTALGHLRTGNYAAIVAFSISALCLSVSILIISSILIERL